jgi:succinoglycan biosynthesis transport protein ExoP
VVKYTVSLTNRESNALNGHRKDGPQHQRPVDEENAPSEVWFLERLSWYVDTDDRNRKVIVNDFEELRRVIEVVARRWWFVILLSVLVGAAGYAISLRQQPVYRATSSVIVGQAIRASNLDTRDIETSQQLALTYADFARRQPVLQAVVETLKLSESWQELRRRVTVRQVPDTQLLEISVDADSRQEAASIADEISRQLILLSPTSLQNQEDESRMVFMQQRLLELQLKIETGQSQLDELTDALAAASSPEQKVEIQTEIGNLEDMILGWETTYARYLAFAGSEESTNYLAVVDEAHAGLSPVRPNVRLNTLITAGVGLVLAIGIIFVLDFLDDTLKTVEDISRNLNLTLLGTVGRLDGRKIQDMMIVSKNPFSPASESYRMIRHSIQFASDDGPRRSILVTSSADGDGKSTTVVNLGLVMASNGLRTILVDADLRRPMLHDVFQVSNDQGLTDLIQCPVSEIGAHLRSTETQGLWLLTAGGLSPNPSELLGSQQMMELAARLINEADLVIYDSPPAAFFADATVLSQKVDGVILVVGAGKTRRAVAKQAVFNLQQAGANILGVVLNRATEKSGGYYRIYTRSADEHKFADSRILAGLRRFREQNLSVANKVLGKPNTKHEMDLILLSVPGIGPRRSQLLLEQFGSLDAIRRATVEEIAAVPGITQRAALAVKEKLA